MPGAEPGRSLRWALVAIVACAGCIGGNGDNPPAPPPDSTTTAQAPTGPDSLQSVAIALRDEPKARLLNPMNPNPETF